MPLTGPVASQGAVHKIVTEIYVEQLNRKTGLLGRPVEHIMLDDQSKPEVTRTLYERLITVDKVDLVLGAFGQAANLSALPVAQRYQRLFITNTLGLPRRDMKTALYEMQFPTQGLPPDPWNTFMSKTLDALASTGNPPKTIAIVTSKFPSLHLISNGAREVAAKRGLNVSLYLEYEFGNRDFGPIAARIKDTNPDFVWVGALGIDGNLLLDAFKKINYAPRGQLYVYPASGPMVQSPDAKFALSMTTFEEHPPFTDKPEAAEFARIFNERAAKAGFPYTKVDQQAAIGYTMWQVLEAAVRGAKSLDEKALAKWLKANRVETIIGTQRFDDPTNFGDDLHKIRQVQDGRWVVVWPKELAAPGAKLVHPSP